MPGCFLGGVRAGDALARRRGDGIRPSDVPAEEAGHGDEWSCHDGGDEGQSWELAGGGCASPCRNEGGQEGLYTHMRPRRDEGWREAAGQVVHCAL